MFNSLNGFQTPVWGPPAWLFLHTISFNYPPRPTKKQQREYMSFFRSVGHVLPCGKCRDNYNESVGPTGKFHITPAVFKSRNTLSRWLYRLHNHINSRTTPPKPKHASYEAVRDRYEAFRATCRPTDRGCTRPAEGKSKYRCMMQVKPMRKCSRNGQSCVFSVEKSEVCKKTE